MRQKLSLKNENRGASLLAVLVVLVVVSAIAVVITKITITNIQMKEVERGTKKNFYSAEEVMDDLHTGAAELSADAMKTAYETVMQNYIVKKAAGKDLQDEFKVQYLYELEKKFYKLNEVRQQNPAATPNTQIPATLPDNIEYSISKYDTDILKNCISVAEAQKYFVTTQADADYETDYKEGTLTLKNVKITYTDSQDYETTITTNFVFTTPEMNFEGGNQMKEFMKYSLIANRQIDVNADNVMVGGSVYAGDLGIKTDASAQGTFTGSTLLTRGDIVVAGGSRLTLGTGSSSIWAENILVNGLPKGVPAEADFDDPTTLNTYKDDYTLTVNGNCYVADDLSLDGVKSRAKLIGNYYGYNFQKNYDSSDISKDAKYSSAMMVNGQKSKLSLEGLNYLMLAGRTFIARGDSNNNDVALGESLAVRTNQLAYYVPEKYLNPSNMNFFTNDGIDKFEDETGISDIESYLDKNKQVVAYHYANSSKTNYYLNFLNIDKANEYFAAYTATQTGTGTRATSYASKYLTEDAIVLDTSHVFTLGGDVMYRESTMDPLKESQAASIGTMDTSGAWSVNSDWNVDGTYFKYSKNLAMQYKSLQLGLTTSGEGVTASDVRFAEGSNGKQDKTVDPMYEKLIDASGLVSLVNTKGTNGKYTPVTGTTGNPTAQVTLVDVSKTGTASYTVPNGYKGIVVANGDVYVEKDFTGLIISAGTITFGANASIAADEAMVVDLFSEDLARKDRLFSQIFNDYKTGGTLSGLTDGKIDVDTYLTYEKWKKN